MVPLLNVILTGRARVVLITGMESVVTRQKIALVMTALITESYTKTGENQSGSKNGDMMENVVITMPYLMVRLLSVILTGQGHVVTKEIVATPQNTVHALIVQTTGSCIKRGKNQGERKCGDMMGNVVHGIPYLMVE